MHNTLRTRNGKKILARDTGKGYKAFLIKANSRVKAPDGLYQIKGGGKIRVKRGWIEWSDEIINQRYYNPAYDPRNGWDAVQPGLG